jgi:hypothetical protein
VARAEVLSGEHRKGRGTRYFIWGAASDRCTTGGRCNPGFSTCGNPSSPGDIDPDLEATRTAGVTFVLAGVIHPEEVRDESH